MSDWAEFASRVISELLFRPVDYAKLAAEEAARTDPWRWYCRICGAKGEAPESSERDEAARAHLDETECGRHEVTGWTGSGRLLHVWTYPASAAAEFN